jgi:type IV pilus assembly protein PilN
MAKINLLPWREELRKQQLREFAVVMGFVVFVAVVLSFTLKAMREQAVEDQRSRNSFIEQQIAEMDEDIKAIEELQKRRDELIERMNVIQGLQGNRPTIVHVFEQFATSLPDGVYYTEIVQKGDKFDVSGFAESNNRIANMMRSLDASTWLKNPQLRKVIADGDRFAFSLTLDLERPAAPGQPEGQSASGDAEKPQGKSKGKSAK